MLYSDICSEPFHDISALSIFGTLLRKDKAINMFHF